MLIAALLWQANPAQADTAGTEGAGKAAFLQGEVSSFGILTDELQARLGMTCGRDSKGRVQIDQVRPGTEAYHRGLAEGDLVLDAQAEGDKFTITISRNGRTYAARLYLGVATPTRLHRETASVDTMNRQPLPANAATQAPFALRAQRIQTLARYNLEFIIDRSLSMRRRDCPGGLSRWDWCAYQAADLAGGLAPYTRNGLTITRFATEFDTLEHASPQDIVDVLERHDFQLGTCLCEPLTARLDKFFAQRALGGKPLLIAVITDGLPWPKPEPRMVREELISASQRMTGPGEVTVVFLQIGGDDMRGRNYLLDLGENLINYGARYQYVHTIPFEELEQVGLERALVDVVQRFSKSAVLGVQRGQVR